MVFLLLLSCLGSCFATIKAKQIHVYIDNEYIYISTEKKVVSISEHQLVMVVGFGLGFFGGRGVVLVRFGTL